MFPTNSSTHPDAASSTPATNADALFHAVVIPVIDEQLVVSKEQVETGRVHISKQVEQLTQTVETPVWHEVVDVQRIPINQVVEVVPSSRQEGDTLILPVVREEVVTSIRYVLVEEVHITRKQEQHIDQQTITLHHEHISVDRDTAPASPDGGTF